MMGWPPTSIQGGGKSHLPALIYNHVQNLPHLTVTSKEGLKIRGSARLSPTGDTYASKIYPTFPEHFKIFSPTEVDSTLVELVTSKLVLVASYPLLVGS